MRNIIWYLAQQFFLNTMFLVLYFFSSGGIEVCFTQNMFSCQDSNMQWIINPLASFKGEKRCSSYHRPLMSLECRALKIPPLKPFNKLISHYKTANGIASVGNLLLLLWSSYRRFKIYRVLVTGYKKAIKMIKSNKNIYFNLPRILGLQYVTKLNFLLYFTLLSQATLRYFILLYFACSKSYFITQKFLRLSLGRLGKQIGQSSMVLGHTNLVLTKFCNPVLNWPTLSLSRLGEDSNPCPRVSLPFLGL